MATANPFDLLGDDDNDDPSHLIASQQKKLAQLAMAKKAPAQIQSQLPDQAKLPTKPLPPAQAVREARTETWRGSGRGGGRGFSQGGGRGTGRFNREPPSSEGTFGSSTTFSGGTRFFEEGETGKSSERRGYGGPRGSFRGSRRGGFSNGEAGEGDRSHRVFERRSGTGRGNEIKREGAGRGNWGTSTDELAPESEELMDESEKTVVNEKPLREEDASDGNKENVEKAAEEEPENKEMTLEEYEKVLEEKRKTLHALKTEERKVDVDKEFQSMQPLSSKKGNDDIFIKLGSDKDKRKEAAEKEERARKSVSINEFLKPADGERFYGGRGSGRGRGRGFRGGYGGGNETHAIGAPDLSIEDPGQFPSLGVK